MSERDKQVDVAVFFDYENIVFSVRNNFNVNANFEDLMDKCKEFGRVVVAHAFADWNRQSAAMIPALISNGFDPVYVPSFQMGTDGQQSVRKNAVDMYMAIDAMDVLHNRRNVDTFILLTGDSDFLPLVNAIRRAGNRVIAIGVDGSSSSHLGQSVDEFIFYSQVSPLPNMQPQKRIKEPYEALAEAIRQLQTEGRSSVLPNVKMMMAELMGGFDERKHTDSKGRRFQKFKDFVQEAERRGIARLVTTGTVNEVFLADDYHSEAYLKSRAASVSKMNPVGQAAVAGKPKLTLAEEVAPEKAEPQKPADEKEKEKPVATAVSSSTRTQPSLTDSFALLAQAARKAIAEEKSNKVTSIKSIMLEIDPYFDEKGIEVDGEKKFTRFSEFIEAALQANYIKITGRGQAKNVEPGSAAPPASPATPVVTPEAESEAPVVVEEVAAVVVAETKPVPQVVETTAPEIATLDLNGMEKTSEFDSRQLVVDSLRQFNTYPAPFLKIEAFCRQIRNERRIFLSSPKVRELLTEATRGAGLLKRISPPGVSPAQYEFNDDSVLVAAFLGIPSEAPAPSEAKPVAPQAEQPVRATAEPVTDESAPKRRGRPKGSTNKAATTSSAPESAVEEAPVAAAIIAAQPEADAAEAPKKRGRKPKAEQAPAPPAEPKKRGRKPKSNDDGDDDKKDKAKDGRKSKSEQADGKKGKGKGKDKDGRKQKGEQPQGKSERGAKKAALTNTTSPEVLAEAFGMLKTAVAEAHAEGKPSRLTAIKARLRRMDESFDESKMTNAAGEPFARFTDFAQAAAAEGLVTVVGSGVATELHPVG